MKIEQDHHEDREAAGVYCRLHVGAAGGVRYCGLCKKLWSSCCGEPRPCEEA